MEYQLRGFVPVTTFGDTYPLDNLIRPFLPRFAPAQLVSYHYGRAARQRPRHPIFVDSGGFAALLSGSVVTEREDGLGIIERTSEDPVTPEAVLELQERIGTWGCPLDFPIPPSLTDPDERARRQRLTLANARWAFDMASERLTLFGPVQGWDAPSYTECARQMIEIGYRHLAIGGMVPRLSNMDMVCAVVSGVRRELGADGMLHVFGVGKPELIRRVLAAGATSSDSSSYVKAAADGVRWDGETVPLDPSPIERCHVALANLIRCAEAANPV